ncbi:MAG: RNA methyltransferase [[Ruminococcus] lactaris]|nr:RNA methyltransferase [[Ruminococcus] lactaris]
MIRMIEITDFHAPELDIFARKTEAQLLNKDHPEEGMFIAESPKVIERALNAGYTPVAVLVEKKQIEGEAASVLARCDEIPVYTAEFDVLAQLTGFKLTRGMLCAMRRRALPKMEDLCGNARRIAVLENVVNPTNVGAIFRSAAALKMDAVILSYGCSDPLYKRASRVAMGNVFLVPWTIMDKGMWPDEGMEILRSEGFKTAAMALCNDSVSIADKNLHQEEKLALILGTEGSGLLDETIKQCDYTVKIPMADGVDSLNVAAAAAVAFWELA